MNLLGLLEHGLFALGQVMRFPVMLLLWICVIAVCFMAGSCLAEYLARRRSREGFNIKLWLSAGSALQADGARLQLLPPVQGQLLGNIQRQHQQAELGAGGIEHLVLEAEETLKRQLNASRIMVKVGPSLGLLGTLIPMGISLAAMAAGNLDAMAEQMVVAFTSTIIGLACGTAAYVINVIKQNWVNETLREQRFIAERVYAELTTDGSAA